jgi:hypothetical protein
MRFVVRDSDASSGPKAASVAARPAKIGGSAAPARVRFHCKQKNIFLGAAMPVRQGHPLSRRAALATR